MDIPIYNGYMKQGADWGLTLEYLDANRNAIDLTGYTADCEIRDKATGVILAIPTIAALGSSGRVALSLTAAQTSAMPAVMSKYDVFITAPTGSPPPVTCLSQGDIEISPKVTAGGNLPSAFISLLLATGQLTSYGSGTGVDDGGLKKGVVKQYTILTTGQYSGTTNIALNGKTDAHSNNCVFDKNTGLMWSRYLSATVGQNSNGTLPWTTNGSGEGFFTYCAAANAASLAGYTDWRVPNIFEIISIIDEEAPNGYPDPVAWPVMSGTLGTSTTTPNSAAHIINAYLTGGAFYDAVKTNLFLLLLVRG